MRERMERFVLLPFTIGCVSESCIAVGAQQQPRRSKSDLNPSPIRRKEDEEDEEEERDSLSSGENMKNSFRSLTLSKPNISIGIHRLFKGFKTVSQMFVYKDEMDEEDVDMEIGCPTDVKHVTHIGLDSPASAPASASAFVSATSASAATTGQMNKGSRDDFIPPATWRQFELSRDSQPDAHDVNINSVASIPLHEYLSRVNYGMRID
ncbi:CRIB domain-containing protein RIC4 [Argentina anserina]|uniref:CRIB domain-containing protein RIC4 n=1 Tax=Argentina anserina TaxID=57926 RepID=UPI0021766CC7|nr:CRIB domain-containing protein RIC4 [Potentilla anserina]